MRILVTGGAGFIGSHLVEALIKKGHEVSALDNMSITRDNVSFLESIGCEIIEGDIVDKKTVDSAVKGKDVIYHLAAMNRAQKSIEDPVRAHDVNINGSLNLLEAARKYNLKKFINISSSSVFGKSDIYPRKEGNETIPPHPYGIGKLTAEHYTRVYHEIFGLDTLTLRFFSVYGPRQKGDIPHAAVIAKFILKTINQTPIQIFGTGKQTRNFTYVKDVVQGCVAALDCEKSGVDINIANKEEYSVLDMVDVVEETLGKKAIRTFTDPIPGDPMGNAADISRAKELLNYNPKYNLKEGIKETVDWYLDVLKEEKSFADENKICVLGLGYVGLPLALEFAKVYETTGFDVNTEKINELKQGHDRMNEVSKDILNETKLKFTSDCNEISKSNILIAAVPTPILEDKTPDLKYVKSVSELIGQRIKKGATVIFESTVYPGLTEEICIPIIEKESGLVYKEDFKVAYSPERINPGDKEHTIDKIVKVVGGCDKETEDFVAKIYGRIITAGIHKAGNIKTAEAAKVIENIQRDLNIGLVNELSMIFKRIGIDTKDVIDAAGSKWNFHKYYPGLVGGHCIPVDPYYLTHKSESLGYIPKLILAGREINEFMPKFVSLLLKKSLKRTGKKLNNSKVLILGLTFKENLKDVRHSRVITLINTLKEQGVELYCYDPLIDIETAKLEFGVDNTKFEDLDELDAVILVTGHKKFNEITLEKMKSKMSSPILVDVKGFYDKEKAKELGFVYEKL
jgi:UDP-N-acetyl-D-galactosamine dehydrogenase